MTFQEILKEAEALSAEERRELIKLLVDTLGTDQSSAPTKQHSILELRGLGKEIWEGIDTQDYINEMRDEWDKLRPGDKSPS